MYNITISIDGCLFEARVKELPDVVEYGTSFEEVYNLVVDTILTASVAFHEQGRNFLVDRNPWLLL